MREILFRGKRADNGEWIYGAFCPKCNDTPFGPMLECPSIIKLDKPLDGFWFDVKPESVGQYIGLRDKNGVKIFEGDIINIISESEKLGVVKYGNAGFIVIPESFAADFRNSLNGFNVEVIGNIHDNSEIIKRLREER